MKQRIISGLIAGALFIVLLYLGGYWFNGLMLLFSLLGFHEFIRMNKYKIFEASSLIGFIAVVYLALPWTQFNFDNAASFESIIWFLVFILLCFTVISKNKMNYEKAAVLTIGVIYIGVGFHYMSETRWLEHGFYWSLLLYSCIWVTDSGAYFTGKAIGKHLLWPTISPKKTIEGAAGGMMFSVAAAICFSLYAPDLLDIYTAVWIGFIVAVAGQMGDLIQSAYKRVSGIKDSGAILPGHGGVLDRCDSWLIVFPLVHLLNLVSL
ncbi:MAG TPA: phosphatidate cytidylyltransferase [Bacilli bacterium]